MTLFLTKQLNLYDKKIIHQFDDRYTLVINCCSAVVSQGAIQTYYSIQLSPAKVEDEEEEKKRDNNNHILDPQTISIRFMLLLNKDQTVLHQTKAIPMKQIIMNGIKLDWNIMYDPDLSIGYQKILDTQHDTIPYKTNTEFKNTYIIFGNFKLMIYLKQSSMNHGYISCMMMLTKKCASHNNNNNIKHNDNILQLGLECNDVKYSICNPINHYISNDVKWHQIPNKFHNTKCIINVAIDIIQHAGLLPAPSTKNYITSSLNNNESFILKFIDEEINSKGIQSIYNDDDKFNVNFEAMKQYFMNKESNNNNKKEQEQEIQQQQPNTSITNYLDILDDIF